MQTTHLFEHYKSWVKAAKAIDISPQLMSKLKREQEAKGKPIPIDYQIKWEVATDGELKADLPETVRQNS
jgi:hypothetical protein